MNKKIVWLVVSCLMVLALLAASCAKAEEKAPAPAVKEAAPAVKEAAPVVKEAAPAVKEAAPAAGAEMVTVTLKKVDGTTVTKQLEKPRYGGTFIFATTAGAHGWDEGMPAVPPYSMQIFWENQVSEELLEGRWEAGPAGTGEIGWTSTGYWANPDFYRGALAESWEFPDDTTIIFHIRKGVRWGLNPNSAASRLVNGREFTAEDAAFNIRRIYITNTWSTMYSMAGVSRPTDVYATDKYTLVVKNAPGQQGYTYEYVGDWMSNYPPEVIKKYGDHNQWENVVGTGPFLLTDYVMMSSGTWQRNPNYWMKDPLIPENQLPYIDTVKLLIIPDLSTQMAALRTGKIDTNTHVEEDAKQVIKTSPPELKYISYLSPGFSFCGFREDKPGPFKDIRVRRALSMAINWKEIVDTYWGGHGEYLVYKVMPLKENPDLWEAYTPVEKLPPAPDGFDNKKLYTYQPEEAKKLLAAAGYPNGFKTEAIVASTAFTNIDTMLMWKEYWRKNLNVDFTVDIKEPGVYQKMNAGRTYNEGCILGRWGDQPYAMCSVRDTIYNQAIAVDPEMDDYYNRMTAVFFDVPKRTKILREMNINVVGKVYYYVPPVGYTFRFWWPWLKGYHGEAATGVDNMCLPKYIWIDQELKKAMGH